MAQSSSSSQVGYIVQPQKVGSRQNPGMPSQYLVCPELAISRQIHLWEVRSTSNRPCESYNSSPDRCGQEPWILVAWWGRADVVTTGTFLGHVCPAVGCPGRGSRRPGLGWQSRKRDHYMWTKSDKARRERPSKQNL